MDTSTRPVSAHTLRGIREVLADMPQGQEWTPNMKPDWGTPGNRTRAKYLAAVAGYPTDSDCRSCDNDVYFGLLQTVRAADAFKQDRRG